MQHYRFGFVIENTLGHVTHYHNLRAAVETDPTIAASWHLLDFAPTGPLWRVPPLKSNWSLRASLQACLKLQKLPPAQRPQVLFFHTQLSALLAVPFYRHLPSVISLDCTPRNFDSIGAGYGHATGNGPMAKFSHWLNKQALQRAARVNIWNEWTRQSLLDDYGLHEGRLFKVPNGIDLSQWPAPQLQIRARREGLARILFVGGDLERKGGRQLLQIWRENFRDTAELHLVTRTGLAAEPNLYLYNNLNANDPHLQQLYYSSDIFVLPSRGDVMPFAVLEAMAAGLPVIASRIGAIPEQVLDGRTGRLIEPGNDEQLRAALQALLAQPEYRRTLGQHGRYRVEEHFQARLNARSLFEVMKQLADRKTSSAVAA